MLNRDVLRFASAILNYSSRRTKTEEEWELNLLVLRLFRIIFYNITRPVIDWKSVPYPSTAKAVTSSANLSSKKGRRNRTARTSRGSTRDGTTVARTSTVKHRCCKSLQPVPEKLGWCPWARFDFTLLNFSVLYNQLTRAPANLNCFFPPLGVRVSRFSRNPFMQVFLPKQKWQPSWTASTLHTYSTFNFAVFQIRRKVTTPLQKN